MSTNGHTEFSSELSPNDLFIILNEVTSMSPRNVVLFGLQLNVTRNVIEGFEIRHNRDMKQCLTEILNERLKQEPPLTWPDIVTALRADSVGEGRLAREIESKYNMPTFQAPSSTPQPEGAEVSLSQFTLVPPQPSVLAISDRVVSAAIKTINRHTGRLTATFGNNLQAFSKMFMEHELISASAVEILSSKGISNQQKGEELLNLVVIYCILKSDSGRWFDTLFTVLSNNPACKRISSNIRKEFKALSSSRSSLQQYRISPLIPDPLITMFIEYVRTLYRESAVKIATSVVKWPPTPSTIYINLALIDRKIVSGKSKEYKEVTEAMVRDGNVDVINETKGHIEFSKIGENIYFPSNSDSNTRYDENKKGRRLILVEGAPGVGKSTFAWEYCRRWERGEIAQQYKLVLLLRLRDDSINRAETLKDLIWHSMEGVPEAVCKQIVGSHGLHAMVILEGFDELRDSGRREGSVFMELISGKLLPLATVLVTSRPWATQRIRINHEDRIYQHIEILGFTNPQISEYIESTIPQEKVGEVTAYLKRHPQIRAGMYIPLNSAIVVTVFQESLDSGCDMPTTLTELYTALVRTLLLRYLHGHPEYDVKYIQEFNDLPSAVYAKFVKLCGVAYKGIVNTSEQVKLIFSGRDLPADLDNLGFMDSVTELYVTRGTVSSHNFLHLTFQEFFAAVHISNMPPVQQLKHFVREIIQGRLKVVLRFLAGLTKLTCISKEDVYNFTQPLMIHKNKRLDIIVTVGIAIVNWMFETQRDDVIALLLEQKKIFFLPGSSNMLPMDYYSLGNCIALSQCQWVLIVGEEGMQQLGPGKRVINVNEETVINVNEGTVINVNEETVKMLAAGASISAGGKGGKVVELRGHHDNEMLQLSLLLLNMLFTEWESILQLRQLSLTLPASCDEITWPDLSKLRVLALTIIRVSAVKLTSLLPHLSLESLTVTNMGDARLVHEDCMAIEQYILNTSTLEHLSMPGFDYECSSSRLLMMARANPTLHLEDMCYIARIEGDDEARDLNQLYNDYPNMMRTKKWVCLANNLLRQNFIKVTGISDAGAMALAQALHHNSRVEVLHLAGNDGIGEEATCKLVQALTLNSICRLILHMRCEEYAMQCPQYYRVEHRICFEW